jgi:hypothetical protein
MKICLYIIQKKLGKCGVISAFNAFREEVFDEHGDF